MKRVRYLKTFAGEAGGGSEGSTRVVPDDEAARLIGDGYAEDVPVPEGQHLSDAEQIDGPEPGTVRRSGYRPTAAGAAINDALDPPTSPPPPPAADAARSR